VSEVFADAEPVPADDGAGFGAAVGAQPNATDTITSNPQYAIFERNSIATSLLGLITLSYRRN
jgi:hypothetical protein